MSKMGAKNPENFYEESADYPDTDLMPNDGLEPLLEDVESNFEIEPLCNHKANDIVSDIVSKYLGKGSSNSPYIVLDSDLHSEFEPFINVFDTLKNMPHTTNLEVMKKVRFAKENLGLTEKAMRYTGLLAFIPERMMGKSEIERLIYSKELIIAKHKIDKLEDSEKKDFYKMLLNIMVMRIAHPLFSVSDNARVLSIEDDWKAGSKFTGTNDEARDLIDFYTTSIETKDLDSHYKRELKLRILTLERHIRSNNLPKLIKKLLKPKKQGLESKMQIAKAEKRRSRDEKKMLKEERQRLKLEKKEEKQKQKAEKKFRKQLKKLGFSSEQSDFLMQLGFKYIENLKEIYEIFNQTKDKAQKTSLLIDLLTNCRISVLVRAIECIRHEGVAVLLEMQDQSNIEYLLEEAISYQEENENTPFDFQWFELHLNTRNKDIDSAKPQTTSLLDVSTIGRED